MESYLMIIFGGSGWTTEGHFKKWEMGVVAGISGNGRWGATDQGQSNIWEPIALNHILLFKPLSPMVHYVVLPPCWNNGKQGDLTFEAVEAIQNLNSWLPGRSLELKDGIN